MKRIFIRALMPNHAGYPRNVAVFRILEYRQIAEANRNSCQRFRRINNQVGALCEKDSSQKVRNVKSIVCLRSEAINDAVQMTARRAVDGDSDSPIRLQTKEIRLQPSPSLAFKTHARHVDALTPV